MSYVMPNITARNEYIRFWALGPWMRPYVREILTRWGRDFTTCEQCGGPTNGRPHLHHTRYEFATIHDIEIVCMSCNLTGRNRGIQ